MNYHSNARLTLQGRERLAKAVNEEGWTLKKAAAFFRVSEPTAAKWELSVILCVGRVGCVGFYASAS
jgi:hypothetical protein